MQPESPHRTSPPLRSYTPRGMIRPWNYQQKKKIKSWLGSDESKVRCEAYRA